MSLLAGEGFALYGTGATSRTNMLLGVFAEATAGAVSCETANLRGSGTHHLRIANVSGAIVRRVILQGDQADGLGAGFAVFPSVLPTANNLVVLFQARDNANTPQWSIVLQSDGTVSIKRGASNGTELAASAVGAIVAGAYQHVEIFGVTADSGGSVEVRVDGQTVVSVSGADTRNGNATVTQWAAGNILANATTVLDIMDHGLWNPDGGINDDFLGDVQWLAVFPTSDGSSTDWTRNTGSNDFECIDDTTPDGDTTYVEATAVGQVSTYGLTNVPANTSDIIGVIFQPMARKTDAGSGSIQSGIVVPGSPSTDEGADTAITEIYTYYPEVFETDPSTGVRFTPSGFNGASFRIERTA